MTRPAGLWLALALLGTIVAGGCTPETRRHLASVLFDAPPGSGAPARAEPTARPYRRPPSPVSAPVPVVPEMEAIPEPTPEPAPPWSEFARRMPKDPAGGVDWVRALEQKLIDPRPGLDPGAKPQPVFSIVIERVPQGQPLFKVTFPHKAHTEWLGCTNCHTGIFEMRRGAAPISMAKIFAGEYCGRCHGKVAFAPPTGCPRCHLALAPPKPPEPPAAPSTAPAPASPAGAAAASPAPAAQSAGGPR